MKLTKNFSLEEFIDKPEYEYFGESGIRLINPKMPIIAQGLKEFCGNRKVSINTWKWGGSRIASGLRVSRHSDYKEKSDHTRGNAIDCVVEGINSLKLIDDIKHNEAYFMALGVTIVEEGTQGWIHLACAWTNKNKIWYV